MLQGYELNSNVISSDSDVIPKCLLDFTFLRKAASFRFLCCFFSFLSNFYFVYFKSFVTFMNFCLKSFIYLSFLCRTSSIESTFFLSIQFNWICIFLIYFSFSYNLFSSSWRFNSRNFYFSLLLFLKLLGSLLSRDVQLTVSVFVILELFSDSDVLYLVIFSISSFKLLLILANSWFSETSFLFLSCKKSIWFCRFFRVFNDFWLILISFIFLFKFSIVWLALLRRFFPSSLLFWSYRIFLSNYFFYNRSRLISSPKLDNFSSWHTDSYCNLYLSLISSSNFFFIWENFNTSRRLSYGPLLLVRCSPLDFYVLSFDVGLLLWKGVGLFVGTSFSKDVSPFPNFDGLV